MTKSLTRKELYKLVWEKPISHIAKDYGISDRGLSKLCVKYEIPLPDIGHWAKIKAGHKLIIPELLSFESHNEEMAILAPRDKKDSNVLPDELKEFIKREKLEENKIVIPENYKKPHPFVEVWNKNDRAQKIKVDRRARKIFSVLLEALEARGFVLNLNQGDVQSVHVGTEDTVSLSINRHYRIYKKEITWEDRQNKDLWLSDNQKHMMLGEQTNYLAIYVRHNRAYDNVRTFVESEETSLENMLNKILIYIARRLWHDKKQRLEREEWHRQRELERQKEREERQRQARIEELRRREQQRKDDLCQQASDWIESHNIRSYVKAIEESAKAGKIENSQEELKEWTQWALMCADELDPINKSNYILKPLEVDNV